MECALAMTIGWFGISACDALHRLDAVDARHRHVHQDHGRALTQRDLYRLQAVGRR